MTPMPLRTPRARARHLPAWRFALLASSLLALAACAPPAGDPAGEPRSARSDDGVVFHRGNGAEPDTLDPHRSEESAAAEILRDLYEGLTTELVDSTVVPGVAESWTISDDGLVYTFRLRDNARWSNGDPVVAEDFVAGMRRSVDPATGSSYAQMLWPIANARAITEGQLPVTELAVVALEDRVLEIRLAKPAPYFLGMLTHSATYPIHRATLAEHGGRFARAGIKVSNGAYRLDEWVIQSHVRLRRNPYYHDVDNVQIDTVYFHNTEDVSSEFNRYRAGELDFTLQIPNNQYRWIRENLADELRVAPYLSTYFYQLNITRPPFDDVRVRKALSMAIDREIITQRVTGVGERPAYAFVAEGVANYTPVRYEWADWPMERRREEAQRLLAEAGFGPDNPLRIEILYNTSENHRRLAVAVASMWQETLGVEASPFNQEWKVMLQTRRDLEAWQVMRYGWIGDYNDPFTFLEIKQSGHGQNTVNWSNEAYDALLARAGQERDLAARAELLAQAERVMLEDYPLIPLYFYVTKHLVKPHVIGYQPNIMDRNYSRHYRIERGMRTDR